MGQWNIAALRQVLEKNDIVEDYRVEHEFETIGKRGLRLLLVRLLPA
ncbi:hypothetical protein [Sinorhizobium alkalisoli]|nr:hypothetical protein [Sinorhizobium alkalisoli]